MPLAAGGDVQQQPEKQQADVGLVLEQLPQVQLLLARGLPGGLGVGLPGEEGEEHGDKGQQAGHPKGEATPTVGSRKEMRKLPIIKRKEPTLRSRP